MATKNRIIFAGMLALVALIAASAFSTAARANPSKFAGGASTATATTTRSFISAGLGTTTLLYDSYGVLGSNQVNIGDTVPTDSAVMLASMSASSSLGVLNINVEYSNDNVDWYQDTAFNTFAYATTTNSVSFNQVPSYSWTFASSTAGLGLPNAQAATTTRAIPLKTPTRFTRVIFSVPVGASPVNVWAQVVPKEERPEGR